MRALVVTYMFPPVGGAGVARTLKLCKYLPAHGVEPVVLTAANPSVPVWDESLLRDVAPDLEILRARTLEPGYALKQATWQGAAESGAGGAEAEDDGHGVGAGGRGGGAGGRGGGAGGRSDGGAGWASGLRRRVVSRLGGLARAALVPDPQILWQPHAQMVLARRLLGPVRDDVVFISGPPFSQFLLSPLARVRPGTAVVLDYRDEWSTYRTTYEMMGRTGAAVGPALERALLRCAHAVTTATEAFRQRLLSDFSFLDPARVTAIPNGYDPDDFAGGGEHTNGASASVRARSAAGDRFVLTYAGTVFKLTSPRGLLGAIRRLHRDDPGLARLLDVRFLGRIVDTELGGFAGTEELGVSRVGYVDKAEVTRALRESQMALCLLDDVPGADRIYPAKIFELMYLGRPTLTLAPPGALADLCKRHNLGPVLPPRDEAAIAAHLAGALRRFRDGTFPAASSPRDIERYHRRAQAGEFARVFAEAVAAARS